MGNFPDSIRNAGNFPAYPVWSAPRIRRSERDVPHLPQHFQAFSMFILEQIN
jgi:hypothetical protein